MSNRVKAHTSLRTRSKNVLKVDASTQFPIRVDSGCQAVLTEKEAPERAPNLQPPSTPEKRPQTNSPNETLSPKVRSIEKRKQPLLWMRKLRSAQLMEKVANYCDSCSCTAGEGRVESVTARNADNNNEVCSKTKLNGGDFAVNSASRVPQPSTSSQDQVVSKATCGNQQPVTSTQNPDRNRAVGGRDNDDDDDDVESVYNDIVANDISIIHAHSPVQSSSRQTRGGDGANGEPSVSEQHQQVRKNLNVPLSKAPASNLLIKRKTADQGIKIMWSDVEVETLKQGLQLYGPGKWVEILRFGRNKFHPKRTPVNLKDKYRNLKAHDLV